MSTKQIKPSTASDQRCQSAQHSSLEQLAVQFPHLTEQQLKVRAWALRDPGERIDIEDDDVAFEEGE